MKLDVTAFRYITKEEFRVLTAVEMGMRNHELVPVPLIESIARVTRGNTFKMLQTLLRNKLVAHDGKKYDGYRMTYHGYDFLAIRALVARGTIVGVGRRIGVGKESDVHLAQGPNGEVYALKLHRLGRISFRNIKEKRDYLRHRTHASWMYMARLAAMKEYAYMKALKDEDFPVPAPIDQNRHCVVMSFVDGVVMNSIRELERPKTVLERLMRLLVRLARAGIIHGDFNEFNLMLDAEEKITLIDFPQIILLNHANAKETFDRDATSIVDFFRRRLGIEVEKWPQFDEVLSEINDAGGVTGTTFGNLAIEGVKAEDDALLVAAHGEGQKEEVDQDAVDDSDDDGDDAADAEEEGETKEQAVGDEAAAPQDGFQDLVPDGGREALADDGVELTAEPAGEAAADAGAETGDAEAKEAADGEEDEDVPSSGEDSDGPGQVKVNTGGKKYRKRTTAKEARTNIAKQQKAKPAKANNQKCKEMRKAKHEVREYLG